MRDRPPRHPDISVSFHLRPGSHPRPREIAGEYFPIPGLSVRHRPRAVLAQTDAMARSMTRETETAALRLDGESRALDQVRPDGLAEVDAPHFTRAFRRLHANRPDPPGLGEVGRLDGRDR